MLTLGRHAEQLRLLPFTSTLATALDKVRAALSTSSRRGSSSALRIRFRAQDHAEDVRRVRIVQILLERSTTVLWCHDLDRDVERPYRLDRIVEAEMLPPDL